jgi:integrase
VSLREARNAREVAREHLEGGADPGALRKAEKRKEKVAAGHTFRAVADDWSDRQKARWIESYADRLRSRLDADLMPQFGDRPLASTEPIEILDAIRKIENRDAVEMARRVLQMASSIFRYGVATSRCMRDPTVDLRGALRAAGPVKHRSALRQEELPDFMARLAAYDGEPTTRLALTLALFTFVRTAELRFARWGEFEGLEGRAPLWRIPAERMKMRRDHLVLLAPQVVTALAELRPFAARSDLLFPAPTRRQGRRSSLGAVKRFQRRSDVLVCRLRSQPSA